MNAAGYSKNGRLFCLLAICFLCGIGQGEKDIITVSTLETPTRYVGTAYVTKFDYHKFAVAKFLGIPYAKQPERFAMPELDTSQDDVFYAKQFGNMCPQIISAGVECFANQRMGENCLFLNIYAPLPPISLQQLLVSKTLRTSKSSVTREKKHSSVTTEKQHSSVTKEKLHTSVIRSSHEVPFKSSNSSAAPPASVDKNYTTMHASPESPDMSFLDTTHSPLVSSLDQEEILGESSAFVEKSAKINGRMCNKDKTAIKELEQQFNDNGEFLVLSPSRRKYAVLVYLHGGAFVEGSGNCYDGSVLAGYGNIVVVTVNYRLGHLGFLSTDDDVIPGNLGLWDQHVAIQWVKKHIQAFGGDPDRITVGGQSAGSYSSIYQALYKGNVGLFQRVLAQSGTPTAVKSASFTGYNTTLEVAKRVNCCVNGSKQDVRTCLLSQTSHSLIHAGLPMLVPGSLPIQPTVDNVFITKDPYEILSQMTTSVVQNPPVVPAHFIEKDLLIGMDAQDGDIAWILYAVLVSRYNGMALNDILKSFINPTKFRELIRMYFQHDFCDTIDEYLIDAVLDRYMDWTNPKDVSSQSNRVIEFLTDVFFAVPVMDTASGHIRTNNGGFLGRNRIRNMTIPLERTQHHHKTAYSQQTQGNTFVYRFNRPKNNGVIPWFIGTGHASELDYVFGQSRWLHAADLGLSKNIMTYWSNFVKTGYTVCEISSPSSPHQHHHHHHHHFSLVSLVIWIILTAHRHRP